jgi:hypothetical protein
MTWQEDLIALALLISIPLLLWWALSPSSPKPPPQVNPKDVEMAVLQTMIKQTARDPSSLQFGKETFDERGVCVQVNGKNAFGGYTGFKMYCSVRQADGTKKITIDGELQK